MEKVLDENQARELVVQQKLLDSWSFLNNESADKKM